MVRSSILTRGFAYYMCYFAVLLKLVYRWSGKELPDAVSEIPILDDSCRVVFTALTLIEPVQSALRRAARAGTLLFLLQHCSNFHSHFSTSIDNSDFNSIFYSATFSETSESSPDSSRRITTLQLVLAALYAVSGDLIAAMDIYLKMETCKRAVISLFGLMEVPRVFLYCGNHIKTLFGFRLTESLGYFTRKVDTYPPKKVLKQLDYDEGSQCKYLDALWQLKRLAYNDDTFRDHHDKQVTKSY